MFLRSLNPAQAFQEIGQVKCTSRIQLSRVVKNARLALPGWKALEIQQRITCIQEIYDNFLANVDEIAILQTNEIGKPISESLEECHITLSWLQWNINNAENILQTQAVDLTKDSISQIIYEPFGVAAVIAPWNYPVQNTFLATIQILLAGNTVVFKHSEECCLTAKYLEEIIRLTSLPDGVFNFVYGAREVGQYLLAEDIDLISFTGSSKVGREVYQEAARKFIPAVLEMGGSSPGVIFPDADLDLACQSVLLERFSNCGQICCALKRLIVHEDIFEAVVSKLKSLLAGQVIGDPHDPQTTLGPLVSERQLKNLRRQIADAVKKGAELVSANHVINLPGAYQEPLLVTNVKTEMAIMKEEVFGPVLPIISFTTEKEAIKIANDTDYGLSAFIYTKNMNLADRVSVQLESGQISINGKSYFTENAPFGGYKKSGLGRTDGRAGYYSVCQMKVVARPLPYRSQVIANCI